MSVSSTGCLSPGHVTFSNAPSRPPSFFQRHRFMVLAVAFNALGFTLDLLSSRHVPPPFYESNPFARDVAGNFILAHGVAYDAAWFGLLLAVGALVYLGLRRFSEAVAQVGFAAWLIYDGVLSYAAALHNLWVHLGWYVSDRMLR